MSGALGLGVERRRIAGLTASDPQTPQHRCPEETLHRYLISCFHGQIFLLYILRMMQLPHLCDLVLEVDVRLIFLEHIADQHCGVEHPNFVRLVEQLLLGFLKLYPALFSFDFRFLPIDLRGGALAMLRMQNCR